MKKKYITWGIIFTILFTILPFGTVVAKAETKVIKVGYDLNANFIKENGGEYYGYGAEYLNKIAEYTGWEYKYVKYESWGESLEKLKEGEIDLICTAHYMEEREKDYIYSEIPLGYETTLLYARQESEIIYQDYETITNCKVGLLKDSYSAKEFIKYTEEHQLDCETIIFDRENEMLDSLINGETDLMAIGSRYGTENMKIVDRLGANAFYCISNKSNGDMITEIEEVLQEMMFEEPTFEGSLNEKYFGHHSLSHTPLYTKEELAYIEQLGTVKVKILMSQRPSCYIENGEPQGIWVEYLKLISEKSGIEFEVEPGVFGDDSNELYEKLMEQDYLALRTQRAIEFSNSQNIIQTDPLMDVGITYVSRQDTYVQEDDGNHIAAFTQDVAYIVPLFLQENPQYKIRYFDEAGEALEALVDNEVDIVIQRTFLISYLMQKPEYADKLTEVPGTVYNNKIHLVASEKQQMLINILNKAISHIDAEEKEAIVTKELLLHPYVMEAEDFWYQYKEWMIMVSIIIIVGLCIYTVLTERMAKMQVQKKEYEFLQKKIQLDELTGLYNRTYFFELAKELIDNSDEDMCIITMDIMNFKVVNEIYGMHIGDQLLKDIADQVLRFDTKSIMIPARFMADHYYFCMPRSEFERNTLPKSFKTFLEDIDIRVIYGVFFAEKGTDMPVNVMCDRAFVAAHDKGYKYIEYVHFYNDSEREQMLREQEIENEMEKALEEKQFYIVVQPKYNPNTEKIIGGETLVRWQHPTKGIISPGIFIPIFEKNGFIIQLDYFVWEETCRLIAKMKKEGIQTVPISVNVSRAHFYGSELIPKLKNLIEDYALDASDLELEITESICGEDPETIYGKIRELQEIGFKIAMDDFGSGYSSLNMLKEMPLDILKMDLKFLDGDLGKGRQILKALIGMAQTLGLKVVVEGVEILSQVEFLRQFKDCYVQGYYFSRPVVSDVFEEIVQNNVEA